MLFKQQHLEGIQAGTISLAFRKWQRPTVKKGSLIKTAVGQLEIIDILPVEENTITESDAYQAGYLTKADLLKVLNHKIQGVCYKIMVRYHAPDPRIKLRSQTHLTNDQFQLITAQLNKLDRSSKVGAWTSLVMFTIEKNPEVRAVDLAEKLGLEKTWLKLNIRKLKNLGLTISHDTGYSLSPLGLTLLNEQKIRSNS